MNFSFPTWVSILRILHTSSTFSFGNSIPLLSKHQISLPLGSPYPVGHVLTLNLVIVISFRLHLTEWLMLITLKRVSDGIGRGQASMDFGPVANGKLNFINSGFLSIASTKRS